MVIVGVRPVGERRASPSTAPRGAPAPWRRGSHLHAPRHRLTVHVDRGVDPARRPGVRSTTQQEDVGGPPSVPWIGGIPVRPFRIGAAVVTIDDVGGTSRHRKPGSSSQTHSTPVARPRVGRQPPQETTTMVVSDGTPVPSAQAAADASRAQRPRSRFSPRSRPAGAAAGTWTARRPSARPRRGPAPDRGRQLRRRHRPGRPDGRLRRARDAEPPRRAAAADRRQPHE